MRAAPALPRRLRTRLAKPVESSPNDVASLRAPGEHAHTQTQIHSTPWLARDPPSALVRDAAVRPAGSTGLEAHSDARLPPFARLQTWAPPTPASASGRMTALRCVWAPVVAVGSRSGWGSAHLCLVSAEADFQRLYTTPAGCAQPLTRPPRLLSPSQIIGPCSPLAGRLAFRRSLGRLLAGPRQATDHRSCSASPALQPTTRATAPPHPVRARCHTRLVPGAAAAARGPGADRHQNLPLTPPPVPPRLPLRRGLHRLGAPHRRCRQEPGESGWPDAQPRRATGGTFFAAPTASVPAPRRRTRLPACAPGPLLTTLVSPAPRWR